MFSGFGEIPKWTSADYKRSVVGGFPALYNKIMSRQAINVYEWYWLMGTDRQHDLTSPSGFGGFFNAGLQSQSMFDYKSFLRNVTDKTILTSPIQDIVKRVSKYYVPDMLESRKRELKRKGYWISKRMPVIWPIKSYSPAHDALRHYKVPEEVIDYNAMMIAIIKAGYVRLVDSISNPPVHLSFNQLFALANDMMRKAKPDSTALRQMKKTGTDIVKKIAKGLVGAAFAFGGASILAGTTGIGASTLSRLGLYKIPATATAIPTGITAPVTAAVLPAVPTPVTTAASVGTLASRLSGVALKLASSVGTGVATTVAASYVRQAFMPSPQDVSAPLYQEQEVQQAGMLGEFNMKTLVTLSAFGAAALILTKVFENVEK